MNKAILQARKAHKKAIEMFYEHTCTIRSYGKYKDPITKETKVGLNPSPKYENQHCKVSKSSLGKNNQTDTTNNKDYEIKLFISPEIEIHQGDEIETNVFGAITKYIAGEPLPLYSSHQEVILENKDKKA